MIHTAVILVCDDGRERSLQCSPGWNGRPILLLHRHRWGRKACGSLRGNWLTDGTPGREACEVSGPSVRRSVLVLSQRRDGGKRTGASWNKPDISSPSHGLSLAFYCHSDSNSFYSGTLHSPLADTQTKQPWCLFSDSWIHQKRHLATCHKQFSSYIRGSDTCTSHLHFQNKTKTKQTWYSVHILKWQHTPTESQTDH